MSITPNSILVNAQDSLQVITNITPLYDGTAQNLTSTDMSEQDMNLSATTTIPITKRCLLYQTMGGSPITLDLVSITDVLLGTQDFSNGSGTGGSGTSTATQLRFVKIINKGTHSLIIEPGATSPYYFDAANNSYKIVVPAGGSVKLRLASAANQVVWGASKIKLTGTALDVYWLLFLGG
jgi:hypothetical protein